MRGGGAERDKKRKTRLAKNSNKHHLKLPFWNLTLCDYVSLSFPYSHNSVYLSCRIVSESSPWKFLRSTLSADDNSEAKGLLEGNVRDDNTPQYRDCLNSWGRLYSASDTGIHCSCFSFLRFKEPRRIIIVLGFAW